MTRIDSVPAPASGPPPSNLLEAREAVKSLPGLSARQRSDLVSAINTVGRHLAVDDVAENGGHLANISTADPNQLDQALRSLPSRFTGVAGRSMSHTVSRARQALRRVGVPLVDGRGRHPLTPAWEAVASVLSLTAEQRGVVNGFAAWCSSNKVEPRAVRQETFDGYEKVFWQLSGRERNAKAGRQLMLALLDTWNAQIAPLPTVRGQRVEAQRNYDWYALTDEEATSELLAEIAAWEQFAQSADPLDPDTPRRVSVVTARGEGKLVRAMAGAYCRAKGIDPKDINGIHQVVSVDGLNAIVMFILDRAPRGQDGRRPRRTHNAYTVARLTHKLARYWVGKRGSGAPLDARTLQKLDELAWRLGPTEPAADERKFKRSLTSRKVRTVSKTTRALLRHFIDPQAQREFLELPQRMFAELLSDQPLTKAQALALTPAFALGLLSSAPVLPGLLASSHCTENVRDLKVSKGRQLILVWPDPRSTTGRLLEYELPKPMVDLFDRYMRQVRPVLCDDANGYLFPGRHGAARNPAGLSRQIRELCRVRLGVAISGQQVRHVLAALVLLRPEGDTREARQLASRFLGHRHIQASDPLSEAIRDLQAGERFDQRHATGRSTTSNTACNSRARGDQGAV